jgi:hypothetical protein
MPPRKKRHADQAAARKPAKARKRIGDVALDKNAEYFASMSVNNLGDITTRAFLTRPAGETHVFRIRRSQCEISTSENNNGMLNLGMTNAFVCASACTPSAYMKHSPNHIQMHLSFTFSTDS